MDFCVSRAHEEKRMDFCCLIRVHLQHYVNSRCRMDFCVSRAHEEKRVDFYCLIRVMF